MKLSELNPSAHKKIYVQGDSGSGKTVFACSFPTPIYVFDFDGKVGSSASFYANDKERLGRIEYDTYLPKSGDKTDVPFVRYNTKLVELENAAKTNAFPYATIVLDSSTLYAQAMLKEVVRQNPGIKRMPVNLGDPTSIQDYGIFASHFTQMLVRLLSLPANVVVTGHISTDKDELTGEIIRGPFLPGKQAPQMVPILFEEVYRAYAETKDGKASYFAQTQSDGRYKCRSQIKGIPSIVSLSYESLKKFMSA